MSGRAQALKSSYERTKVEGEKRRNRLTTPWMDPAITSLSAGCSPFTWNPFNFSPCDPPSPWTPWDPGSSSAHYVAAGLSGQGLLDPSHRQTLISTHAHTSWAVLERSRRWQGSLVSPRYSSPLCPDRHRSVCRWIRAVSHRGSWCSWPQGRQQWKISLTLARDHNHCAASSETGAQPPSAPSVFWALLRHTRKESLDCHTHILYSSKTLWR